MRRIVKRQDRAVILVLVLWILIVLAMIAYSLLFQVTTETTITASRKKYLKAQALARAGVAKSIIDLRNDLLYDASDEQQRYFDAEGDVWARIEEGKEEVVLGKDKERDGYFNAVVFDESGLININFIGGTNMVLLQKIMERIGYEEEDAKFVAGLIVDWRDGDTIPTLPNTPSNEEGRAYAVLINEDAGGETDPTKVQPLRMRNESFLTVEELLEIPGVTAELFFGPGSPEAEYFAPQLIQVEGDRFQIKEKRRSRSDGPVLGLRDYITVNGPGSINMNTAPAHVLAAFAEAAGETDGDRFAERVVRTRRGGKDHDIDNSSAFKTTTEVQANPELQSVLQAGGGVMAFGVSSPTYRIISEGVVGNVRARMEVLVHRQLAPLQRVESFEYNDRAQEARERNSGRYERRENNKNELQVLYPYVRILQAYQD